LLIVWIGLSFAVGDDEVFVVFAGLAVAEVVGRVGIVGVFGLAAVTQFLHAAEDAALELGFVPLQLCEGLVISEIVEEELAEDFLIGAGVVFGDGTAEIVEDQCLVALGTLDAPGHAGNAADEEDFAGIERLILVHEFVGEGVELGGVFDGDGGTLGGQAVNEGVAGGTGLACGGFGAGGFFGVETVGFDLFCTRHDLLLLYLNILDGIYRINVEISKKGKGKRKNYGNRLRRRLFYKCTTAKLRLADATLA